MNRARSITAPPDTTHDARDFAIVTTTMVGLYAATYWGLSAAFALGWHA